MQTVDEFSTQLNPVDVGVIIVYFAVVLAIGFYYRKFASGSLENYFLGGRKLKGWTNGFSYTATCMNTDVAPAYCGMTVATGLFICWWYFSRFGLALMIGGILFAVFWRGLKRWTPARKHRIVNPGRVCWDFELSWLDCAGTKRVFNSNIRRALRTKFEDSSNGCA